MSNYKKIDDVVFPASDLSAKQSIFYSGVWLSVYRLWPESIAAFTNAGLEGGFFLSDKTVSTCNGSGADSVLQR